MPFDTFPLQEVLVRTGLRNWAQELGSGTLSRVPLQGPPPAVETHLLFPRDLSFSLFLSQTGLAALWLEEVKPIESPDAISQSDVQPTASARHLTCPVWLVCPPRPPAPPRRLWVSRSY